MGKINYVLEESKNNIVHIENLDSGSVFIANSVSDEESFLGMKIETVDGKSFIYDFDEDCAYGDLENYNIIRLIDCVLVESKIWRK